jgi:hypothetical protein
MDISVVGRLAQPIVSVLLQQEPDAIIVTLDEPASDLSRLRDVLVGSIGLGGVIGVIAIVIGIGVGALLFWLRSRREPDEPTESLLN